MNGAMLLRPMLESFERLVQDKSSQALTMLSECKSLARNIKAHRNPDISVLSLASLPTKEIADRLIDGYLRSSESIFRVLHIPSFKREYQGFWSAVADGTSNTPAVYRLQVKLVMAIGAATFDKDFSLRATAVQWVQEAETWLSRPSSKSRLSIPALQATILLHIARQTTGIGADLIWISTGTLIRTAIAMGMHRDPKKLPKTSLFSTEIRRRLWNTILEIAVQSSIDSGGPPMISLTDFDTEPPDNLDDMHLTTEDEHIAPQAVDIYTQVSVAIAMRRTFPIRLAIAKALNDLRPTKLSYHDLIRIDAELREAYKQLSRHLHGFKDHTTGPYELRFVDLIIRRYFLALHLPLFGPALHDATFAYSRRVVIDTATKLWQTTSGADDLASLSVCGAGFFRTIPIQAALVIAAELRAQLLEEECLGPRTARPDLVAILKESKDWSLKRIEAGETNIKGHLSICALIAQIDAIAQNLSDNEGYQSFVASVQQALHRCLAILQAASHVATISDSANEVEEDWEMPDFQFGVPESEGFFSFAPNWLLGDILPNVAL
ncbi:fungal-specific transcription factor domain-containing protein [Truncatella angustata]|uniref:Fungal-specific transcription factor domain-containing protein n=1 Tax=Truncatella angustata TaxID=152316 RepID=A0A9P8UZH0_9PEZI|nr:fungal-specific transcription factor domain-containing protein [Truncatella angustata]KAH6661013.1 fungal-specific transcription factor domain-containing protein [Truncatella angustata]